MVRLNDTSSLSNEAGGNLLMQRFQMGKPAVVVRAVQHPTFGALFMARDLFLALGYRMSPPSVSALLIQHGVSSLYRTWISPLDLRDRREEGMPPSGAIFLTRAGMHLVMMASGKPLARSFRQWLAEEAIPSILDTGGYQPRTATP